MYPAVVRPHCNKESEEFGDIDYQFITTMALRAIISCPRSVFTTFPTRTSATFQNSCDFKEIGDERRCWTMYRESLLRNWTIEVSLSFFAILVVSFW